MSNSTRASTLLLGLAAFHIDSPSLALAQRSPPPSAPAVAPAPTRVPPPPSAPAACPPPPAVPPPPPDHKGVNLSISTDDEDDDGDDARNTRAARLGLTPAMIDKLSPEQLESLLQRPSKNPYTDILVPLA